MSDPYDHIWRGPYIEPEAKSLSESKAAAELLENIRTIGNCFQRVAEIFEDMVEQEQDGG